MADPTVSADGQAHVLLRLLGPVLAALCGIAAKQVSGVLAGHPFSLKRAALEGSTSITIGIMAAGVGQWAGLPELTCWALAAAAGRYGTDAFFAIVLKRAENLP